MSALCASAVEEIVSLDLPRFKVRIRSVCEMDPDGITSAAITDGSLAVQVHSSARMPSNTSVVAAATSG